MVSRLEGRRRVRRRFTLVIVAAVLLVIGLSLKSIATFFTDYLWFRELGQTDVFWKTLTTKIGLGLIFGLLFFALLLVNLLVADRLAPIYVPAGPEEEIVGRYREAVAPYRRWIRLGISLVLGFFVGMAAVPHWSQWLLFLNRSDFGVKDPQFNTDIGFLVFQLPFYEFLVNWFLGVLIFVAVLTAAVHYVNGGIRFQTPRRERVLPAVKGHLSVLFFVIALFKAVGYWLNRYQLLYSERGPAFSRGASATDVNAQLKALQLLVGIMLIVAVLFLVNIKLRGWLLPAAAISMWLIVAIMAGGLYPLLYQRFKVVPQEATAERPFVDRNLRYTQLAYNLVPGAAGGGLTSTQFAGLPALTPADVADNAVTLKNVRLWDPKVLPDTYKQLQSLRNFYDFNDVDVDRYFFDATNTATGATQPTPQQVLLGVRELRPASLPSQSWVNLHLQFTHGYGLAMSEANSVEPKSGLPIFLVQNIPVSLTGSPAQQAALQIDQPRIYYGEGFGDYAIVNTSQPEFDYTAQEGKDVPTVYDGSGGVRMSNLLVRFAFALRFANANPLISGQIKGDSRAIFHRDISERIHTLAPFLALDNDPYPAIVDRRLVWIQDTYTVTDKYPYAKQADFSRIKDGAFGLKGFPETDYIRNSVKAVVDAYDGTVRLYVTDPTDPIIQSYTKIFPNLFNAGPPSPQLRAHFRYPEDLFRVQSDLYGQYHVTDPDQFFRQQDVWSIPGNPAKLPEATREPGVRNTNSMVPYYLLMRLPDDPASTERFVIMQPFTPANKNNMVSFLVARSDPDGYGKMTDYRLPTGTAIEGPIQVFARIQQEQQISSELSLLNQQGSEVLLGNLLVVPVEKSVLYVQPVYVQSARENTKLPQLNRVVVVYGDQVRFGKTMDDALQALFGTSPASPVTAQPLTPTVSGTPTPSLTPTVSGPVSAQVQALLDEAAREFALAQDALRRGNLAEYEAHIKRVGELISQAQALSRSAPAAPGSTTTAAAPPPAGTGPSG